MKRNALLAAAFCPIRLIAEVSLERSPYSTRGVIAMTAVSWVAATAVIVLTMRRGMFASPPAQRIRRGTFLSGAIEFLFGILIVAGLGGLMRLAAVPKPVLPAGWSIVRPPQEVSALAVQGSLVWAGGTAGLAAIDRRTAALRDLHQPLLRYVKSLLIDHRGTLWVAHGDGLTTWDGRDWRTPAGVPRRAALALLEDRAGNIWVGTTEGIFRLEGDFPTLVHAGPASVLFQDRDGVIWSGWDAPESPGLWSFDGSSWRQFTTGDGLADNSVTSIVQERSGALWFGTGFSSRGGATRLDRGQWRTWTRADGLAGTKVRSIFEDRAGWLWFGSEYDGVAVTDRSRWRILTPRDGLAGIEVKKMLDADGVYWLATENGVSRIERLDLERTQ